MAPSKEWDEEDSDSSSNSSPPAAAGLARRSKFADEEEDDDVLESWDAAEDSEVEREKAKKAEEAKAKADAEAAANKKSKKERVAERQAARAAALEESDESDDETEADKRARLRATEKDSDLKHAEDLFGDAGLSVGANKGAGRKTTTVGSSVPIDPKDPSKTIDLSALPLFSPQTKTQFQTLRETMVPILGANYKKAHYTMFLQEFSKQMAQDLPSDQIKKISSTLTALANEKQKQEKASEKTGKKTKAQKTKTSVVTTRANENDTAAYEDNFGDDDFM